MSIHAPPTIEASIFNSTYFTTASTNNLTQDSADSRYLRLTGGTETGAVNFQKDLTVDTNVLKVDTTTNYVGINTSTPTCALDVTGAAKISAGLTIGGAVTGYSTSVTPAAGQIGYTQRSFLGVDFSVSSGSIQNVITITLGVGTWVVIASIRPYNATNATTSTISGNSLGFGIFSANNVINSFDASNVYQYAACKDLVGSASFQNVNAPIFQIVHTINLTASTTLYLNSQMAFTNGAVKYYNINTGFLATRIA